MEDRTRRYFGIGFCCLNKRGEKGRDWGLMISACLVILQNQE